MNKLKHFFYIIQYLLFLTLICSCATSPAPKKQIKKAVFKKVLSQAEMRRKILIEQYKKLRIDAKKNPAKYKRYSRVKYYHYRVKPRKKKVAYRKKPKLSPSVKTFPSIKKIKNDYFTIDDSNIFFDIDKQPQIKPKIYPRRDPVEIEKEVFQNIDLFCIKYEYIEDCKQRALY